MRISQIASGFSGPIDAEIIGNKMKSAFLFRQARCTRRISNGYRRLWKWANLPAILLCIALDLAAQPRYVDVAQEVGIDFLHHNGAQGDKHIAETMGSGVAFLDYDSDGWYDLYFVNIAGPASLYRNRGDGGFVETAAAARVADSGYGIGCAAADYDNDGDVDLYITAFGPNLLFRNEDEGVFSEVAQGAMVDHPGLSSGAAFGDYDRDGDLDLFVANYVEYGPQDHKSCTRQGLEVYCGPESYDAAPDLLYRNEGDGRFTEMGKALGLQYGQSKSLGAIFTDYDNDGDVDLYVAGDRTANLLYQNDGGSFTEISLLAGVSSNDEGILEAGMGVAVGDYDNDGFKDIYVTNFLWESNTLYHNEGDNFFVDVTSVLGLATPSIPFLSWGTAFLDWDNDEDLDIFVASGHLDDNVHLFDNSTFDQPNQLYQNDGELGFVAVGPEAGPGLGLSRSSRGAATGDYDNDGDVDIAVSNNNERAILLRNEGANRRHWLGVRTVGRVSNRDGIGTQVIVSTAKVKQVGEVRSGDSYLSQHDPRVFFGLGDKTAVDWLECRWPSGKVQRLENVEANQLITVWEEAD